MPGVIASMARLAKLAEWRGTNAATGKTNLGRNASYREMAWAECNQYIGRVCPQYRAKANAPRSALHLVRKIACLCLLEVMNCLLCSGQSAPPPGGQAQQAGLAASQILASYEG